MSRWLRDRLRPPPARVIGIDARSSTWRRGVTVMTAPSAGVTADGARASESRSWLLVVGLDLAVHWMQAPPGGLASFAELRQAASARCAQLHGGEPGDWWVAGDWDLGRSFVCAALPRDTVRPWVDAAQAAGVSLRVETTWTAACAVFPQQLPDNGWVAMTTPGHTMAWHLARGRVNSVLDVPLGAAPMDGDAARRAEPAIRLARLRLPELSQGPMHWHGPATSPSRSEAEAAFSWGEKLAGVSA